MESPAFEYSPRLRSSGSALPLAQQLTPAGFVLMLQFAIGMSAFAAASIIDSSGPAGYGQTSSADMADPADAANATEPTPGQIEVFYAP